MINSILYKVCVFFAAMCLLIACGEEEQPIVSFDCGLVDTEISAMRSSVGSYNNATFTNNLSEAFEIAAIAIDIVDFVITTETQTSCATFTAVPQKLTDINISSSESITIEGVDYAAGQNLSSLFKIHGEDQTYIINDFISTHNENPLLFYDEGDQIVLQLLSRPDNDINQPFTLELLFNDSKEYVLNIGEFIISL